MQLGERAGLRPAEKSLREVFGDALLEVTRENEKIIVLDGDLGNSTKSHTVRRNIPERFFNMGIAESNLVGVGAGLASCGFIPFITSFSSFMLFNAYDQIRISISMSNVNAKLVGSHGGITLGKDGPTQMAIEDFALTGGLPNLVPLVPSDSASMHAAVRAAVEYVGPVFIRSSRVPMPDIYDDGDCPFEIGKANVVRAGDDVAIVACGLMVSSALDAAAMLAEDGIQARVIDLHTLRPFDTETIVAAARETGAVVTAEEHLLHGGMGSNVARLIAQTYPVPMRFVGLEDVYVESAPAQELLRKYHLTADDIAAAARDAVAAKGRVPA